jgi:hypothetical protein
MFTILLITIPGSALASSGSPYDSGYNHGCDDARISDPSDRYINQPEKGPAFHTSEFMNGYDSGFNSCYSDFGESSSIYTPNQNGPTYEESLPQSTSRSQANCDDAGLVGGVIGGGAALLSGNPSLAPGGAQVGSSFFKGMCESNNR